MVLRASKFFGYCYSDEISEKEFFGKNFTVNICENELIFSFDIMRGLDAIEVKKTLLKFTFFEIEDVFLKNKILKTLNEFPQAKKISLQLATQKNAIKQLKITHKGFLLRLV